MNKAQTKKAANQTNSKLWCISYAGYALAKEIVSLLSLQLMYSYSNESVDFVCCMQPSFTSWPHSDITSLGCSATYTFLASPFLQQRCCWDRISFKLSGDG